MKFVFGIICGAILTAVGLSAWFTWYFKDVFK